MITALIGQRGSGKSALLRRAGGYFAAARRTVQLFDLDVEVSRASGMPIEQIFREHGEAAFRVLENQTFERLVREGEKESSEILIAVGAGFEGEIPSDARVIWVRRPSDDWGRIFLDRPRLNAAVSPLTEYAERAREREERYRERADEVLTMIEGASSPDLTEKAILLEEIRQADGIVTVLPEHLNQAGGPRRGLAKMATWGLRLELRDDLLSESQCFTLLERIFTNCLLFSIRRSDSYLINRYEELSKRYSESWWDWALELGEPRIDKPSIISIHERMPGESLIQAADRLEAVALAYPQAIRKLAVSVEDHSQLSVGDNWCKASPTLRAFLPRSENGRFLFYRLWNKHSCPLGFIRDARGSSPDQPSIMEWLSFGFEASWFAAILGHPVFHSRTPAEHAQFFRRRGAPVLRIDITVEDIDKGVLELLHQMGLKAAAITSPLKQRVYAACKDFSRRAYELESVNTVVWDPQIGGWRGHNTDYDGVKALLSHIRADDRVAVWGGGGTRAVIQARIPQAKFHSVRQGGDPSDNPTVLIWAVSRDRTVNQPPESFHPRIVLDLNYAEDSPGRAFAKDRGSEYVSGLAMFKTQARAQRAFWENYVR